MAIHLLEDTIVAQIAAGEVVERPASVVKELLENALDAGADSVHVMLQGGGRQMIRISDNGSGIPADEIELAFARHATSKLRALGDLERIQTLGFRGEALSSIASVSRVTMTTRHRDEDVGTQIRVEGGEILEQGPAGAPAGTVISVENLFFNTPARLKFLKRESTEKRHVTSLVTRYAMAYPSVRFVLEQDNRELLRTNGTGQLQDVMVKVFGLETFRQMIPVDLQELAHDSRPRLSVSGFTSLPALNRSDRTQIAIFINGRWVNDTKLTYAVVQAYHTLLDGARYPIAVLMVNVPPQEVDVNVHPTKAEVRFRDPNAVFTAVQRAVREAVIGAGQRPGAASAGEPWEAPDGWSRNRKPAGETGQFDMDLDVTDSGTLPRPEPVNAGDDDETAIPEGAGTPVKPRTLPLLRVVGQVGASYIVAEGPAGLYLIDQHAAHHRVLYEALYDQYAAGDVPRETLTTSQTLEVTPKEATRLEAQLDVLTALGYEVESFGQRVFVVRTVPEVLGNADPVAAVRSAAADDHAHAEDVQTALMARLSEYGAVRTGQVLDQEAMQVIVRQLERARQPMEDPYGHPTFLHMTGEQLAREFGR